MTDPVRHPLDLIMVPRSVAIIGASDDPTRIGGRPVRYFRELGFASPFYPVNPGRKTVQGIPAYASVTDIPGPVDLAIIALPAVAAVEAVRACAAKGVGALIIFSGGFAESGPEGARLQDMVVDIANTAGMPVLGPNCIGAINLRRNLYATFLGTTQLSGSGGRSIALASQSGGYASHILNLAIARGLSVDHLVTTGNECVTGIGEVMLWMARSPDVHVIVAYIEGVRDPEHFVEALRTARRLRKPVIVLKVGTTAAGAAAAVSHTASITGEDSAYSALLHGAYRAETTTEALEVAYAATAGVFPFGRRLGVISMSGGAAVQLADFAVRAGLSLPQMSPERQEILRALLPSGSTANPVDTTAQLINQPESLYPCLEAVAGSGLFDALIVLSGIGADAPHARQPWLDGIGRIRADYPGCLFVLVLIAPPDLHRRYEALGCVVVQEPADAVRAVAAMAGFRVAFDRTDRATPSLPAQELPLGPMLSEVEAKAVIAAVGVAVPQEHFALTPEQAADSWERIGGEVAVKIVSVDLMHKSDAGGVRLRLTGRDQVRLAAEGIAADVALTRPSARQQGFLVSEMLTGGVECLVGIVRDKLFGPVLTVGLGGVATELLRDVATRLAPVTPAEAADMLESLRGALLLHGYRGRPSVDMASLAVTISLLSRFAADNPRIATLEVNPLLALPNRSVALDAVIVLQEPADLR